MQKTSDMPDEKLYINGNLQNFVLCRTFGYNTAEYFCKEHNIGITYNFHDFFSCCPSFFLMGPNGYFCNYLQCDKDCIQDNPFRIADTNSLKSWRSMWGEFLSQCSTYRFFSENTFKLVSKIYSLNQNKVVIKPHELICLPTTTYKLDPSAVLRIAVVGAWEEAKGSREVEKLANFLQKKRPEVLIYFYGNVDDYNKNIISLKHKNIVFKGRYNINELPKCLTDDKITVAFFSSVCPETFSFVTQECIHMNIPLLSFNIGASGDRIKKYKHGFIAEDFTVESVYQKLLEVEERYLTENAALKK